MPPVTEYAKADFKRIKDLHLKILVVDDESDFRCSMLFKLRRMFGAEVGEASTAQEAVEMIDAGLRYDVIFLDLWMNGKEGFETHRKLQRHGVDGKIVIMSSAAEKEDAELAASRGIELLSKPIPDDTMLRILGLPAT
jgi:CheY-like chemotaxis protein